MPFNIYPYNNITCFDTATSIAKMWIFLLRFKALRSHHCYSLHTHFHFEFSLIEILVFILHCSSSRWCVIAYSDKTNQFCSAPTVHPNHKSKGVSVHATRRHIWRTEVQFHSLLTSALHGSQCSASQTALPQGKEQLVRNEYDARWTPELVWTFGEDKNFSPSFSSNFIQHPQPSYYTDWTFHAPGVYMNTTSYLTETCITQTSRSVNCL